MPATELLARLQASGCLVVAEGKTLKVKGFLNDELRREIREHKSEILRLLEGPGDDAGASPCTKAAVKMPVQDYARCPCCGGGRWWTSIHGIRVCGKCHPPASPELVVRWEGPEEAPKEGALNRRPKGPPPGGGHRGGFMPPMLPGPNPLDFRFDTDKQAWVIEPGWWKEIPKRQRR